jgi:hypothetical protein
MERERRQLTIELWTDGSNLLRRYHVPVFGADPDPPPPQPLAQIGKGYRALGQTGLAALSHVLASDHAEEMDLHLVGDQLDRAGELLFEVLFGADELRIQRVIRWAASLDEPAPTPIRVRLRVRIRTDIPELCGLPWRVTQWKGYLLRDYDWTFEMCAELTARARIDHKSPGRILLIAPPELAALAGRAPRRIEVERHVEDLSALLDNLQPGFAAGDGLRVARSRGDLERGIGGFGPDLIYFYGHGEARLGVPHLRLGDGPADSLPVRDFASLLRDHRPRAVFLNACWAAHGGFHAAGHQLLPRAPLVIVNSTAANGEAARRYALNWIEAWLGRGEDPVEAAHVRPEDTKRLSVWTPAVLYADYDTWTTSRPAHGRIRPDRVEDWFDRERQRSIAYSHVTNLVRHERQRVEALLAYAAPGNALERVFRQIIDYIEREAGDRIHIHRLGVPLPDASGADLTPEHFALGLKAHLGVDPRDAIGKALTARAPLPKGNAGRVLWLDWGVVRGRGAGEDEVFRWLEFARDSLATTAFHGFRVVASMAIEAEGDDLKTLMEDLPTFRGEEEFWTDRFRCAAVDPLNEASKADVLAFLEANGCDPGDVRSLGDAIFQATLGKYDKTQELLREGLRLGWRVLLNQIGGPNKPRRRFGAGRGGSRGQ